MIPGAETDRLDQGYYRQSGTVIQRRDSVKSGNSLLLFLRDLGPRWVCAPGSSAKSRFCGAIEPLVWGTYDLYQSPTRLYLKSAEVKEDFLSLRTNRSQLMAAIRFYKNVTKLTMTTHESNKILNVLWSAMVLLKEDCPIELTEFRYIWKLLNSAGLAPSLSRCVICGSVINNCATWTEDGFCCDKCNNKDNSSLSAEEMAILQHAALLEHDKFIRWSKQHGDTAVCNNYIGKLLTFF